MYTPKSRCNYSAINERRERKLVRPANKTSVNDTRTAASKKRVNGRRGVPYRQHNVHSRVQSVSYSRGHRIIRSFLTFDSIRIVSIFLFLPSPPTFHPVLPFPVYLRQFPLKGSGNGERFRRKIFPRDHVDRFNESSREKSTVVES